MTTETNKPFLRALKCAYKLHKAGLSEANTVDFLGVVQNRATELPSAAAPCDAIIIALHDKELVSDACLAEWADQLGYEVLV